MPTSILAAEVDPEKTTTNPPFVDFAPPIRRQDKLRQAITDAYRRPECICVPPLIEAARVQQSVARRIKETAQGLIKTLRSKQSGVGIQALMQAYSLSTQEGIALMCLAEALLRIPDRKTRDALIRDKITLGNWTADLRQEPSLFVNAAKWGFVITRGLVAGADPATLKGAIVRLIARFGQPVIRRGVDVAMQLLGKQFVAGETIEQALRRGKKMESRGYTYSYDMLGEAAITAADAERYFRDYLHAIESIGKSSTRSAIYERPGISIKLSALHPRYSRAQAGRVMRELVPKVSKLAGAAKRFNIGLNIDAEEADRLELSLDILEELAVDGTLAGWNGLGFVVQAYGKRAPFVIDYLIDLARRSGRRLMVRLVKGAYWDSEIKRAQLDGLDDYPVYTRKVHTDVAYLACARKLLSELDVVFPQFATHNAQTLSAIYHSLPEFESYKYEFQCLHGMGEHLYDEVVGKEKLDRPCRIYAPVGTHQTLLPYLVRRLLENGANSSFVNRLSDRSLAINDLSADPVEVAEQSSGMPHPEIPNPSALFGDERLNSRGIDLSNEAELSRLSIAFHRAASNSICATPLLGCEVPAGVTRKVVNPGDHSDIVGHVTELTEQNIDKAISASARGAQRWSALSIDERANCLLRASDIMQSRMESLSQILVREAGKTTGNAIGEVRETIDFLRYYASQALKTFDPSDGPLGVVVCISPWNFPLAIFTGQVAAALVAGNAVLAKPASMTPLIAFEAVGILHEAGVPRSALQYVPGGGSLGAALVASSEVAAVMFTGSTGVARAIQQQLSKRLSNTGKPIPFIAETGGLNAMIVDSSALTEQVVADVLVSSFDSAGQRCSALRVLCIQEEVAERTLQMLQGALSELALGRTDQLNIDLGPVITEDAKRDILRHIEEMKSNGLEIYQPAQRGSTKKGTFVPPTIVRLESISQLVREVFGPVLHVVRYERDKLNELVEQINSTGYGLTFGLHTRVEATVSYVLDRVRAGNMYVNRNMIGAVVGVQPFGGRGMSGTGPKAGGPLYLRRLRDCASGTRVCTRAKEGPPSDDSSQRSGLFDHASVLAQCRETLKQEELLAGPVGERNLYRRQPRGRILLLPQTAEGLCVQLSAALSTGNRVVIESQPQFHEALSKLPSSVVSRVEWTSAWESSGPYDGALIEGEGERVKCINQKLADYLQSPIVVQAAASTALAEGLERYDSSLLLEEVSVSINTAAVGGNANLLTLAC